MCTSDESYSFINHDKFPLSSAGTWASSGEITCMAFAVEYAMTEKYTTIMLQSCLSRSIAEGRDSSQLQGAVPIRR